MYILIAYNAVMFWFKFGAELHRATDERYSKTVNFV